MKRIFLLTFVFIGFLAYSQQDPQFSMYMFNGQYINPGYVGSKGVLDVSGIYRYQWAGSNFDGGAPQSGNIGANAVLKKEQYAVGGILGYDRIGYTDMYSFVGQFAYRIPVAKSKLSFAVQSGVYQFNDNRNNAVLVNPGDIEFAMETRLAVPNVGAGVYMYGKRYYVGVSVPHIFNMNLSEKLQNAAGNSDLTRQYRHVFATAGIVVGKEEAFVKFKPSILVKYVNGIDKKIPDFDINASFLFVDRLWVGTSLRTGGDIVGPYIADVVGMVEVLATQQLRIGYAYDYVVSDLRQFTGGSHEVMMGYTFGYEKKKFVNVRYGTYF